MAIELLVKRHNANLYRKISYRSPRKDWVDEIVQESWFSLHEARHTYKANGNFFGYLFTLAHHCLIEKIRKEKRTILVADLLPKNGQENFEDPSSEDPYNKIVNKTPDKKTPEKALEDTQSIERLQIAMDRLPAEQRVAVCLQKLDDMSLEDIAAEVGASFETIKSRLRYAMRTLRAQVFDPTPPKEEL